MPLPHEHFSTGKRPREAVEVVQHPPQGSEQVATSAVSVNRPISGNAASADPLQLWVVDDVAQPEYAQPPSAACFRNVNSPAGALTTLAAAAYTREQEQRPFASMAHVRGLAPRADPGWQGDATAWAGGLAGAPTSAVSSAAPLALLPTELAEVLERLPRVQIDRRLADLILRHRDLLPEAVVPRRAVANRVRAPHCVFLVEPKRVEAVFGRVGGKKARGVAWAPSADDEDGWTVQMQEGSKAGGALGDRNEPTFTSRANSFEGVLRLSGSIASSQRTRSEGTHQWEGRLSVGIYILVALPGHPQWASLDPIAPEAAAAAEARPTGWVPSRGPLEGFHFKFLQAPWERWKLVAVHPTANPANAGAANAGAANAGASAAPHAAQNAASAVLSAAWPEAASAPSASAPSTDAPVRWGVGGHGKDVDGAAEVLALSQAVDALESSVADLRRALSTDLAQLPLPPATPLL